VTDSTQKRQGDLALYLRLLRFARPYWRLVVVLLISVGIGAAMEPLMPALMKPLIDESLIAKDPTSLWMIPLLLVLVVLIRGAADYAMTFSSAYLAQRTVEDLRQALFAKQLDLSLARHAKEDGGRMLTRITYDTQMVLEAVSEVWLVLIRDTLVLIGLIGFLFYTAWELTIFVFLSMPVLVVAIRRIGKKLRSSSAEAQQRFGRLNGFLQEALLGLTEIKAFGAQRHQESMFHRVNERFRTEQMRVVRTSALAGPIVAGLTALTVAVVIYFASFMTAEGKLTPGEFVAFITALAMVFGPIRRLTATNIVLQRGLAAADSIFSLLDDSGESGETPDAHTLVHRHRAAVTPKAHRRLQGEIKFQDVSFRYPHQEAWALEEFNLSIQPREAVAVVGPSGSGKSTLIALLARFHKPSSGSILLDGEPIESYGLEELRSNLALVSQRVMLFDGTILENISLGKPQVDRDLVIEAAKSAHAWEFIEKLPDQLDTPLGSLGDRLSGGQRQRIAIARAFLKDTPILLLDEATSALDRESEEAVLDGLERLIQGRTVLMVSHSPERLRGVTRTIDLGALKGSSTGA
jgi:ATP-binding cassette, subfamily B, bacterial MsbA